MKTIAETLKTNRPNITDSSLKTYVSILNGMYKKINGGGDPNVKFFLEKSNEVMKHLEKVPFNTRKTKLASLVSLCGDNEECASKYRKMMLEDIKTYNDKEKTQEMTETQKDNWITQEELMKIYHDLHKDAYHLFNKSKLTKREMMRLQDLVTLSLYVLAPPRRLKDYTQFKLYNYDENDNHLGKGRSMIFNDYKTKKTYGRQEVSISPKLYNIIKKWGKKHDNEYLLFSENGKPLTEPQLTLRLNKILGKKASVNILRHSYISEKVLKDMPLIKELQEQAEDMGHSLDQQLLYKKVKSE